MADSDNPSPIASDYSSPADDSSSADDSSPADDSLDSSSPATSDDPLPPLLTDSDDSIAADSLSPFAALEERMEAGYYPTSDLFFQGMLDLVRPVTQADFERPESPMSADSSPIDPVTEQMVADYYGFELSTSDDPSDESLGMVDDHVSIPIRRQDRLEFESYVPEPVRNEIKKIFRKYKNDLIDCPEAVEKFKLLLPENPHKLEFYDRIRTELYLKKADISKYIEWLTDLDQYTDGVMSVKDYKNKTSTYLAAYPDLYNIVQSLEEEPMDTDENKEEPMDNGENKEEEPKDNYENKEEEPKDNYENKEEEPKDTDENKEEQPKDTDEPKEESPKDTDENKD